MLEFSPVEIYNRRNEIVASIGLHFLAGRWLDLIERDGDGRLAPKPHIREWCAENFKAPYGFSHMSIRAITTEDLHLHVTSDIDAVMFKLHWF